MVEEIKKVNMAFKGLSDEEDEEGSELPEEKEEEKLAGDLDEEEL